MATVTSEDLVNMAVSVAALAVNPSVRVVLRAGDDDAVTETRALFAVGVVRDVNRIGAAAFAAIALGQHVQTAFVDDGTLCVRNLDGRIERVD